MSATIFPQRARSSCAASNSCTGLTRYFYRVCFIQINITASPPMVDTMLQRMLRSLFHQRLEHCMSVAVINWRDSSSFLFLFYGSLIRWLDVSSAQPSNALLVFQEVSPLPNLLIDIGFCCSMHPTSFGQKMALIPLKISVSSFGGHQGLP